MKRKLSADQKRRREMMLQALDDQLNSPDTPEVRAQYQRLIDEGHDDDDTRELMATILSFYIWHTMRRDDYTYTDYVAELAQLPKIDWASESNSPEFSP